MQPEPRPHPDGHLSAETPADTASDDDIWPATAARPPLAVLLRDGFRWFTDRLNATVAEGGEPGISAAAAMVVSYLHPEGSRPAEIARAMGVSRQHIHTVSRELTDAGILATQPDPASRRDRLLVPTPAGEQRRRRALAQLANLEVELAQRLDPGEIDQLRELLTRLWSPSTGHPPSRAPHK
ncbi:MarR family winged helix-turn-helix transcriptional regulator [Streptomyces cinereospinus]|uniref:MarR family winged helix-turn-helix transcriptional regulator n=1 Tax=Streptomyces cinereospinus TaxID=285561 RepID=A0ABV5MXR6_9ACTN